MEDDPPHPFFFKLEDDLKKNKMEDDLKKEEEKKMK
jgi:hypothetical protein